MAWSRPVRFAQWLFASGIVAAGAGCPELNQWSGPSYTQNPFMSVDDDVPGADAPLDAELPPPEQNSGELPDAVREHRAS